RHMCCLTRCFLSSPLPPQSHTLSLHDALPIFGEPGTDRGTHFLGVLRGGHLAGADRPDRLVGDHGAGSVLGGDACVGTVHLGEGDRKSTRLNSSHVSISYAVFCLKKKNENQEM